MGLGYAAATISALVMLALGVAGNFGIYTGAVEMMQRWHIFFSLSLAGIFVGMVEAAVFSFVFGYAFGVVYNKTSK